MSTSPVCFGVNQRTCCVPQCGNIAYKKENLRFHRFPCVVPNWPKERNERALKRRNEWIRILKISRTVSDTMCVCSEHFQDFDYFCVTQGKGCKRRRLKETAIPSKKLPLSSTKSKEKILKASKKLPTKKLMKLNKEEATETESENTDFKESNFQDSNHPKENNFKDSHDSESLSSEDILKRKLEVMTALYMKSQKKLKLCEEQCKNYIKQVITLEQVIDNLKQINSVTDYS